MPSDPSVVPHVFSLSSLAYGEPPNTQSYIRINMFFMKKKDISWEYFTRHWHHVHADIVTGSKAFKENHILRYTQFYQSPEHRTKTAQCFANYPIMEWDACSEFWVEKMEDFEAFLKSDEYIQSLPDVDHFIATEDGIKIMAGSHTLIYGENVPGYGRHGVLEKDLK